MKPEPARHRRADYRPTHRGTPRPPSLPKLCRDVRELMGWVNQRVADFDCSGQLWSDASGVVRSIQDHPNFKACRNLFRNSLIVGPRPPYLWLVLPGSCVLDVTLKIGLAPHPLAYITRDTTAAEVPGSLAWGFRAGLEYKRPS